MTQRILLFVVVFGCCMPSRQSLAQDVANEADLLFRRGGAAFKAGKYDEALLSFLASNRLVRNRNVLYNVAFCYLRMGQFNDAFRFFSDYQREPLPPEEQQVVATELARLQSRVALIAVTSKPSGALVFVDRKDLGARGTTPGVFALPPGSHTVFVELAGYHEEQRAVTLALGKQVDVAARLRLKLGAVAVRAQPAGAEIRVDRDHGPALAVAPGVLELAPGRHAVYLALPGYRSARNDVEVRVGRTLAIDATLEKLPLAPAKLVVTSGRAGALVDVDGQHAGTIPVTLELAPGRHRLDVTEEDYAPFYRDVELAPGARLVVDAQLTMASEVEVAAASKMVQSVEEAPSSVTVISGEEIRALGYRTLGEALRGTRGFYLSDDRQYQAVGVRGFSPPGDLNPRLLILSDGHSTNDLWTGASFVGHDFAADLSDVERIEVVRGPGSALYGTGAFFAVVDVATRSREERRFDIALGSSSLGEVLGHGTVYQALGRRAAARFAAGFLYSPRGASFADPTTDGIIADNDGETAVSANGRVSVGDFTFTGRFNERKKTIPTSVFNIIPDTGRAGVRDRRAFAEGRYERDLGERLHVLARLYYDHTRYDGRWPYSADATTDLTDRGAADWLGGEARVVLRPKPWLNVVTGAEGLFAPSVIQGAQSAAGAPLSAENRVGSGSGYALAEVKLPRELRVVAGLRADYSTTGGFSPSPDAALVFRPYGNGISKFLFGRAFRAPSVYEISYHDGGVSLVPSANLGPETIYTWQLEHTHAFGRRIYLTGSTYYNDVHSLINLGPATGESAIPCAAPEGCVEYQNQGHVGTLGAELELRRAFGRAGSFSLAYAFQRSRDLDAGPLFGAGSKTIENSPEHLGYFRMVRPVVRELLVAGAELIYGSPRVRRDGASTAHMLLANLTLSGRVSRAALHYALSLRNVFDWRYGVPVGAEYPAAQLEVQQLGRTVMGTLGTSF